MAGAGESDLLVGGRGKDRIDARDDLFAGSEDVVYGVDKVQGGPGNDVIDASESLTPAKDRVDCGPGKDDQVTFDRGLDTIKNCERKNPIG